MVQIPESIGHFIHGALYYRDLRRPGFYLHFDKTAYTKSQIIEHFHFDIGYVRGSPNGKICKSTNGTVGTIFTNGNQKTLNVFLLPMVPLVDHMVEFLSY